MSIWTAFFLVVSIVILATPLLLSRGAPDRIGSDSADAGNDGSGQVDDELELDLASGRLTREDYEVMSGKKSDNKGPDDDDGVKGDHGSIPEG